LEGRRLVTRCLGEIADVVDGGFRACAWRVVRGVVRSFHFGGSSCMWQYCGGLV